MMRFCVILFTIFYLLHPGVSFAQSLDFVEDLLRTDKNEDVKKNKGWKYGSIMYDKERIGWVREAVKSYEEGIPLEILLPDIFTRDKTVEAVNKTLQEDPIENLIIEKPVFYLNSILYFENGDWAVWINDEKISHDDEDPPLDIIKVTEKEVILVWRRANIDNIYPGWRKAFRTIGDGRFVSNGKNMVIDVVTKDVSFILSVNQALVSSSMKIVEGESGEDTTTLSGESRETQLEDTNLVKPNQIDGADLVDEQRLGELLDSENMDKYLSNINMLKSILSGASGFK